MLKKAKELALKPVSIAPLIKLVKRCALIIVLFIPIAPVLVLGYQAIPVTYTLEVKDINLDYYHNKYKIHKFILDYADSNDTVRVKIASNGGFAELGVIIANAALQSEAKVITKVELNAYSAGAIILMAGKEIEAAPISAVLFHKPFYILMGQKVSMSPEDPFSIIADTIMRNYVNKYLTLEEIAKYEAGGDVTISGPELIERIKAKK